MKMMKTVLATLASFFVVGSAFAQDAAAAPAASNSNAAILGLAVAIVMGLASGLGTLSQSRAAAAALEGIARNPQAAGKVQTPMIIAMALMESLVILAFVIALQLLGKIA